MKNDKNDPKPEVVTEIMYSQDEPEPKEDESELAFSYNEKAQRFTVWRNNTHYVAKFSLMSDNKKKGKKGECDGSTFFNVVIKPGQTATLEKQYDQAIRFVHPKSGVVMGGLCPWLTKEGEKQLVIHKSLNWERDVENLQLEKTISEVEKENRLLEAVKRMEERKHK